MTLDQALRRIAELQEENAWLRSELGLVDNIDQVERLRRVLGISPGQAHVLLILHRAKGRPVTYAQLSERIPVYQECAERGPNYCRSMVSHVRSRLGRDVIEAVGRHGAYRIGPRGAEIVRRVLEAPCEAKAA